MSFGKCNRNNNIRTHTHTKKSPKQVGYVAEGGRKRRKGKKGKKGKELRNGGRQRALVNQPWCRCKNWSVICVEHNQQTRSVVRENETSKLLVCLSCHLPRFSPNFHQLKHTQQNEYVRPRCNSMSSDKKKTNKQTQKEKLTKRLLVFLFSSATINRQNPHRYVNNIHTLVLFSSSFLLLVSTNQHRYPEFTVGNVSTSSFQSWRFVSDVEPTKINKRHE